MQFHRTLKLLAVVAALAASGARASAAPGAIQPATNPIPHFAIEVVDEQTGRGVPLVELKTVASTRYYTDSAGLVAFDDAGLMGRTVFFYVTAHGYASPKDGFGMAGVRLDTKAGGSGRIKIKRVNIAERLYRLTGEGIYRDSVMLGRRVPVREPLLNAQVSGQDSVQQAIYRGKMHWFFGDTMRPSYPLGHFWMAGATLDLPGKGGLDPSVGVDMTYFIDADGFSRGVYPRQANSNPAWLDGFLVLPDESGRERLLAKCQLMHSLDKVNARRLCVFNDENAMFDDLKEIPLDAPLYPLGHPVEVETDGVKYLHFGDCWPYVRCRADWKGVQDLPNYEAFTPLAPGERFAGKATKLERDGAGKLVWAWKRDTAFLDPRQVDELVKARLMRPDEYRFFPADVETKKPVLLAMGSVKYNAFRKKWVMIGGQVSGGPSNLGEIWYAESDKPEGPWPWARRIVTHDRYSLYNPLQHPAFEQEAGRIVYFQGTYTGTFSREHDFTPRYEYNQIMYRLDLADRRLQLPADPSPRATTRPAAAGAAIR